VAAFASPSASSRRPQSDAPHPQSDVSVRRVIARAGDAAMKDEATKRGKRVAVVGGGVSGLSAAYLLQKRKARPRRPRAAR